MTATDSFYIWFYTGLGGLGGWFIFFLLALAGVVWVLYDSATRRLPATEWKLGVILTAALLLPAIIMRFSAPETQQSLSQFLEGIFYLGLLGGVVPPVLAVGYYVTFRDMVGCARGHVYERVLGECPECARLDQPLGVVSSQPPIQEAGSGPQRGPISAPPPEKPKAQAWLVSERRNFQLNLDETTIGRSSRNDIQLTGDATVGREHAKIIEQNGHFRIYDLGSTNGTRVNERLVRQPVLLEANDVVQFGDHTTLRFVK
jgi:hypothetical protein